MKVSQHIASDPQVTQRLSELAPHSQKLEALRITFKSASAKYRQGVRDAMKVYDRNKPSMARMTSEGHWTEILNLIRYAKGHRVDRHSILHEMNLVKNEIGGMIGEETDVIDLTNAWPGYNAVVLASDDQQMISFTVGNVTANIMVGDTLRAIMEVHSTEVCQPMIDAGYTQVSMHIYEFDSASNSFSANLSIVEFGALIINNLNEIQTEDDESE